MERRAKARLGRLRWEGRREGMCDTCTGGVDSFVLMPHTYTHLDDTIRWSRTGGFTAEKRFVIVSSGGPQAAQVASEGVSGIFTLTCVPAGWLSLPAL